MIFTIRWLGGTIGTALITLFFNASPSKNNVNQLVSMTHALTMSCILLACIALIGFVLATLGLKKLDATDTH